MRLEKWFTTEVDVYRPSDTVDNGGAVTTASTLIGSIECHIYSVSGTEFNVTERIETEVRLKMLCGIDEDITAKDYITYRYQDYDVIYAINRNLSKNPHKEILLKVRT